MISERSSSGSISHEKREEFSRLLKDGGRSFLEVEDEVLGMNHAALGGTIAAAWNFPLDIQLTIAGHHRPDMLAESASPVPWIVHLADQARLTPGIGEGNRRACLLRDGLSRSTCSNLVAERP